MNEPPKTGIARLIISMTFFVVVIALLPLLVSRRWDWWEAWVYAIVSIVGFVISRWIVWKSNPDLIRERARIMDHKDAATWDKTLVPLLGLGGVMVPLIAGLDALVAGPPPFYLQIKMISLALMLTGFLLASYALIENRFFSGMVRLQSDRDHYVIKSGPYRWVRHPGYAGSVIAYIATPFFLDSMWSYIPVIFAIIVIVIRTSLEDKFLRTNLMGYTEYAEEVRYRLFPGVW